MATATIKSSICRLYDITIITVKTMKMTITRPVSDIGSLPPGLRAKAVEAELVSPTLTNLAGIQFG